MKTKVGESEVGTVRRSQVLCEPSPRSPSRLETVSLSSFGSFVLRPPCLLLFFFLLPLLFPTSVPPSAACCGNGLFYLLFAARGAQSGG